MSVRPALFQDIPRITELALELHRTCKYSIYKPDVKTFKETCMESIRSGNHCVFVNEQDGIVEGFIIGITAPLYVFIKEKYATDLVFYVSDKGRSGAMALAAAFDNWARNDTTAVEVWLAVTDVVNKDWRRLGKAYSRMGYDLSGGIYMKRIER